MKPDPTIVVRHRIDVISYQDEVIDCTCGETVTAEPDGFDRDRHGPLVAEWEKHRRGGLERVYGRHHAPGRMGGTWPRRG